MNTKDFKFKLANLDEKGAFTGFASIYGNTDSYGDAVMPGAFTKTIQESGGEIPILYQHHEPIGKGRLIDQQDGLSIEGNLILEVPTASSAYALAKAGVIKGLSIGYKTIKDQWDHVKKTRQLLEVKLYEVSLVTFPANPLATITGVKSADMRNAIALIEDIKAGRTISKATRGRIEAAIKELEALLAAEEDGEPQKSEVEPEILHSYIEAWKQARQ